MIVIQHCEIKPLLDYSLIVNLLMKSNHCALMIEKKNERNKSTQLKLYAYLED